MSRAWEPTPVRRVADVAVSPPADLCRALRFLRVPVSESLDLSRLHTLRAVDLTFGGPLAEHVLLPPGLESCRANVTCSASPLVLGWLLAQLPAMRGLHCLDIFTDHQCTVDLATLAPSLRTLVVSGSVYVELLPRGAVLPCLEVMGLTKCMTQADDLNAVLMREWQHGAGRAGVTSHHSRPRPPRPQAPRASRCCTSTTTSSTTTPTRCWSSATCSCTC